MDCVLKIGVDRQVLNDWTRWNQRASAHLSSPLDRMSVCAGARALTGAGNRVLTKGHRYAASATVALYAHTHRLIFSQQCVTTHKEPDLCGHTIVREYVCV